MAKTLVEDLEETRIPFLRGILIRSLQDAGLEFDQASHIASEIRNELSDTDLISTEDLYQMVLERLTSLGTEGVIFRYENRNNPVTVQVEQQCGRVNPFSRLKFRHSLETIGLKSRESEDVVQMLQEHLTNKSIKMIKSRNLAMLIYRYLRQSSKLGPAVAHRWLVWHDFINSGRPLIFLIGGTAGCGKSSTANTLASRLEIVRTQSTDMLREVMRMMVPERLMPVLHTSSFKAWEKLPGHERVGDLECIESGGEIQRRRRPGPVSLVADFSATRRGQDTKNKHPHASEPPADSAAGCAKKRLKGNGQKHLLPRGHK